MKKGKTAYTGVGIDELNQKIFDKLTKDDKKLINILWKNI